MITYMGNEHIAISKNYEIVRKLNTKIKMYGFGAENKIIHRAQKNNSGLLGETK